MVRHSWRTELKAATAESDVLAVVQRYLHEWSEAEIAALPSGAWPRPPRSRRELLAHGMKLAELHAEYAGTSPALRLLQELLLFLTHAGVRISQLAALEARDDCPGHPPRTPKKAPTRPGRTARRAGTRSRA